MRRVLTATVGLAWLLAAGAAAAQHPARHLDDPEVYEIASQLRCVVCQNLSVADSPSEMAAQMREVVRERLRAGESREQVLAYFVDKYGEWILLKPRPQGFTLLVWVVPPLAVVVGLGLVAAAVRRWASRGPRASSGTRAAVDPVLRERIRRELEREP